MVFGYIVNKKTGKKESYFELDALPKETEAHQFVECDKASKPEIDDVMTPEEKTQCEIAQKIENKKHELAVTALKAEGALPADYEDAITLKIKDGKSNG